MKNRIEKYFVRQLKAFEKNFKKSRKKYNIDAIHKMRLSIKRTKALFLFLEYIDPENFNAKQEFKSLKHLFKLAGNIRDIQIQIRIVKGLQVDLKKKFKKYISYLKYKEKEAKRIFNEQVKFSLDHPHDFDIDKIREVLKELSKKEDISDRTISLINQKISDIDELRKDLSKDENIHAIRTAIKQIHYLFDFNKKYVSKKLFLHLSKKKLKKIENIFGEWHDMFNALVFLDNFLDEIQPEKKDKYLLLKNKLIQDKNMLFMQIKHILQKELLFYYVLEL